MQKDPASMELLREIVLRGPITRTDLAARTNLSLPSLTRLLKGALEIGIIQEEEEASDGRRGRPTRPLSINPSGGFTFGVKITGDEVTVVAVDLGGQVLAEQSRPLVTHEPPKVATFVAGMIGPLLTKIAGHGTALGVGVGVGGTVTSEGIVHRGTFLGWRDVDFAALLEEQISLPVIVENDVVALTTYEHWFGAGKGLHHFAVITVGAGVGHGLVVFDKVLGGEDTGVGLAGHVPLDSTGPLCHLGHRGCSSALLTTDALATQYSLATQSVRTFADLMRDFDEGDPAANVIVRESATALGKLIALSANLGVCSTVVLAGEAVGLWDAAPEEAAESLAQWRSSAATPVDVRIERAGFTAWSVGGAALALQEAFTPQR